jgi:hypothetical protein
MEMKWNQPEVRNQSETQLFVESKADDYCRLVNVNGNASAMTLQAERELAD